jgi:hypothetical protein
VQIVGHLLEGDGELEAMVDHSLLETVDIFVTGAVCALSILGTLRRIADHARQLSQPLSVLFFKRSSLFQKCREILVDFKLAFTIIVAVNLRSRTLAEATLCFKRVKSVVMPICMRHNH